MGDVVADHGDKGSSQRLSVIVLPTFARRIRKCHIGISINTCIHSLGFCGGGG